MEVKVACLLLCLAGFGPSTLQAEDVCRVSTLVHGGQNVRIADGCVNGSIAWDYPEGLLNVTFPRSVLPELSDPEKSRYAMKVCFRGVDKITAITQHVTTFKGKTFTKDIPIASENRTTTWMCGRPSRFADGAMFSLTAPDIKYYIEEIEYQVESCERLCGWMRSKRKDRRGRKKLGGKKGRKGQKGRKKAFKKKLGRGGKRKWGPKGRGRGGRRNKQVKDVATVQL